MEIAINILICIVGFIGGFWIGFTALEKFSTEKKKPKNALEEMDSNLLIQVFSRYRNTLIRTESYEEISAVDDIIAALNKGQHHPDIDGYQVNSVVVSFKQFGSVEMAFYVSKREAELTEK